MEEGEEGQEEDIVNSGEQVDGSSSVDEEEGKEPSLQTSPSSHVLIMSFWLASFFLGDNKNMPSSPPFPPFSYKGQTPCTERLVSLLLLLRKHSWLWRLPKLPGSFSF